jgi:hypothetical protein
VSPLTAIKAELLRSKRKGRLCREQDCSINGQNKLRSNSVMSAAESSAGAASQSSDPVDVIECHDGHVWAWLRLMELGGVGPDSGVDIRGAVARCLASSGALMWSAIHGATAAPIGNPLGVAAASKHGGVDNGSGDLGCRVWTLALQLMQVEQSCNSNTYLLPLLTVYQDDDSEVRSWMNDGVSEAVALLCQVEPQFKEWMGHKLSAVPCMEAPRYSINPKEENRGYVFRPESICCGNGDASGASSLAEEAAAAADRYFQTNTGAPTVQVLHAMLWGIIK